MPPKTLKSRSKSDAAPASRAARYTSTLLRSIRTKAQAAATTVRAPIDVQRGTVRASRRTAAKVRRLVSGIGATRDPVAATTKTTRGAVTKTGVRRRMP